MTTITMYKNSLHMFTGFKIEGHANYSLKGFDIVCAAISTISQAVINGIEKVLYVSGVMETREGYLEYRIRKHSRSHDMTDAQVLFNTMELTIKDIAEQYNNNVKLQYEKEV